MPTSSISRSMPVAMAAAAILVACAPPRRTASSPDPSGRYEFDAVFEGRSMEGVVELARRSGGEIGGQLRLGSLPPAKVVAASQEGTVLTLRLQLPEGPASATFDFGPGNTFRGEIRVGPNRIPVHGRRVRSGPRPALEAFLPFVKTAIDSAAEKELASAGEPGLAVAAVDGRKRWVEGYGRKDMAAGGAVDGATLFQVGSISKLLTAWGVMRLVDSGVVELDAPVNRYLKRWKLSSARFDADGATVHRLLSHTAGVNVPSISGVDLGDAVPDLIDELNGRGRGDEWKVRLVREPGTAFHYSGGGYMILQLLIEDVTGRPFDEYMRREVLLPLGMEHSWFGWNQSVARAVATPYSKDPKRNGRHRLFAGLAGAGLYTCAEDLADLIAAHFPGADGQPAGRGVVRPRTLASMMSPDPVAKSYGMGYEIYPGPNGATFVGHGGSNVGWKSNLLLARDLGVGFAVVTNSDEGTARAALLEVARDAMARLDRGHADSRTAPVAFLEMDRYSPRFEPDTAGHRDLGGPGGAVVAPTSGPAPGRRFRSWSPAAARASSGSPRSCRR